jgi:hypothetical protein
MPQLWSTQILYLLTVQKKSQKFNTLIKILQQNDIQKKRKSTEQEWKIEERNVSFTRFPSSIFMLWGAITE